MKLEAVEIAATSARMEWRHLDEQEEKPHVDGVQVEILDLEPILIKKNSFLQLRRIQLDTRGIPVSHVPEVTLLSGSAQTYCSSCHLTIWSRPKQLFILQTSPFIHRDTNYYVLENLQVVALLSNNRIAVVSSPFNHNGLNGTEWAVFL